jgi:perosamine synthetase
MNPQKADTINGYWMPTVLFSPESGVRREQLLAAFQSAHIDARVFFWPLTGLSLFKPQRPNQFACEIPGRAINLPSYHDLTDANMDCVADVIFKVLQRTHE